MPGRTGGAGGSRQLSVSAAAGPEEGDEILETEGPRVFLDSEAAVILDKVLDAQVGEQGNVEFLVAAQ